MLLAIEFTRRLSEAEGSDQETAVLNLFGSKEAIIVILEGQLAICGEMRSTMINGIGVVSKSILVDE